MNSSNSLLILGFVWPEPNSSAAGTRMIQLISLFKNKGFEVTFASPALDSEFMINLKDIGVNKCTIALNCSSFDSFVRDLNPTVVLFDRFMMEEQFGWRVADICPNALRLLDTEDLHCLRLARQNAFKNNRVFEESDLLSEDVAKREIASILRCDLSLMISKYEIDLLERVFKIDNSLLYYLPFLLDSINSDTLYNLPLFEERNNFIFIGNFLHEPNWNAVQYLKETIWPLIKKRYPEGVLHIYGAYPSQKVLQLHQPKEGFYIMGRAIDANQVVKEARVVLAPLRFGAGLKGKLVEAMLCGTPSVTTTIGAESMHADLHWNGFVHDNPQEFAESAIELYQNKILWSDMQSKGIAIINECYSKNIFALDFMDSIFDLLKNLKQHRSNNFFGGLLQHHTIRSTKYMSKWIEEKNKIR
ncbi:glycosyltransferase [Flavobacterium sp. K5-23]|uniref:glycosyltransferase n=1 Tax=Flavobacterium sp. K5-23 TaxID=2746225 RepID=UPI00200BA805|nr:glycosyltransferase [Flavobacterium sp. K5-23]UQD56007.1 glycosyltransferase family 4 protein [Flavobacterium sp. K5-23]